MNKTIDYYKALPYTIEMVPGLTSGWVVRVKELPGCISQGDTPQNAFDMIHEALSGWLEIALEDGILIPEPRPSETFSGKFVARVSRSLHRALAQTAEREGVSLNQFVSTALARAVGEVNATPDPPPVSAGASDMSVAVAPASATGSEETTHVLGDSDSTEIASRLDELLDRGQMAVELGRLDDGFISFAEAVTLARRNHSSSPIYSTLIQSLCINRTLASRVRASLQGAGGDTVTEIVQLVRRRNLDSVTAPELLPESFVVSMPPETAAVDYLRSGQRLWNERRSG